MGLGEDGWDRWVGELTTLRSRSTAEDGTADHLWAGLSFAALVPTMPFWQVATLVSLTGFLYVARMSMAGLRLRKILQPVVLRYVQSGTSTVLAIQACRHPLLDAVMAMLSVIVSAEFYTAIVPLLMWSCDLWLGRHLLMVLATSIYMCNVTKDMMSAPRPPCPPVKRLAAFSGDKIDAEEYGLPSGHTANFLAMALYAIHYLSVHSTGVLSSSTLIYLVVALMVLMVAVSFGRLYLGMHSVVDVVVGAIMGLAIGVVWCNVDTHIQGWITSGTNVIPFQVCLGVLLLNMYPAPEMVTPSFEYHTACTGVVTGMVCGCSMMYSTYHRELVSTSGLFSIKIVFARMAIGYPAILFAKSLSKGVAKWVLPIGARFFALPVYSSEYIPALQHRKPCPPVSSSLMLTKLGDQKDENHHEARSCGTTKLPSLKNEKAGTGFHEDRDRMSQTKVVVPASTAAVNKQIVNKPAAIDVGKWRNEEQHESHLGKLRDSMNAEAQSGNGVADATQFNVDVGVRLLAYAGQGLALEGVVPLLFSSLGL